MRLLLAVAVGGAVGLTVWSVGRYKHPAPRSTARRRNRMRVDGNVAAAAVAAASVVLLVTRWPIPAAAVAVLVVYLFAALTGLYWSYNWYRDAMFAVTGAPKPAQQQQGGDKPAGPPISDAEVAHDVSRAWSAFQTSVAGYETATIRMPTRAAQPVQITYLDAAPPHLRATNRIMIDPVDGATREHERYADKPAGAKIMSSVYALHTGRFFGMPGVIVLAITSLTMAISGISGWLLYLDRRRTKALRRERSLARAQAQHGRQA